MPHSTRALALLLALSPGCATDDAPATGEATAELNVATWEWWLQAAHSTQTADLGPDTDRTCFLSGVGGAMAGNGEVVAVTRSGGRYTLTVASAQPASTPLRGAARCIATTRGRTAGVAWSQGSPSVNLGANLPAGGGIRSCFLTRITGKFRGGGESVHAFESGGSWFLGGTSQQSGIAASAVCITSDNRSGEWTWQNNTNAFGTNTPDEYALETDPGAIKRCFLTGVSGDFESSRPAMEVIWVAGPWTYPDGGFFWGPDSPGDITQTSVAFPGRWEMWLGAMTTWMQGKSVCIW